MTDTSHLNDMAARPPGLATERTALAWHRTAIAALLGEAAVFKSSSAVIVRILMSVALVGLMIACEAASWHRGQARPTPVRALPTATIRAIGIVVAAVATGAFALALVPSN
jgi:uncharacterized membrane protein YidH (DUF202 family)